MRFLIYGIFLSGWVAMWVWTYTCHIKKACCPGHIAAISPLHTEPADISAPVAFAPHSSAPIAGVSLPFYRDSLIAELDSGMLLQITGLYVSSELASLGMDRARSVLDLLAPQLEPHRYALGMRSVPAESILLEGDKMMRAFDVQIAEVDFIADSLSGGESR